MKSWGRWGLKPVDITFLDLFGSFWMMAPNDKYFSSDVLKLSISRVCKHVDATANVVMKATTDGLTDAEGKSPLCGCPSKGIGRPGASNSSELHCFLSCQNTGSQFGYVSLWGPGYFERIENMTEAFRVVDAQRVQLCHLSVRNHQKKWNVGCSSIFMDSTPANFTLERRWQAAGVIHTDFEKGFIKVGCSRALLSTWDLFGLQVLKKQIAEFLSKPTCSEWNNGTCDASFPVAWFISCTRAPKRRTDGSADSVKHGGFHWQSMNQNTTWFTASLMNHMGVSINGTPQMVDL